MFFLMTHGLNDQEQNYILTIYDKYIGLFACLVILMSRGMKFLPSKMIGSKR